MIKYFCLLLISISSYADISSSEVMEGKQIKASKIKEVIDKVNQPKMICQTKKLQSDKSTNNVQFSDLVFHNLTIGKQYRIYAKMRSIVTSGGSSDTGMDLNIYQDTIKVCRLSLSAESYRDSAPATFVVCDFIASHGTLSNNITSLGPNSSIMGNNTTDETFIRLCELQDGFIQETTQWD